MKGIGAPSLLLTLSLLCFLRTTTGLFSAPNFADHHLETHLMEWKTLPGGERVSSAEKMHRQYMQTWKRRTAEASAQQWRAKRAAIASDSDGRELSNSRSVVAANAANEVNALLAFRSAIAADPTGALTNWTLENEASHCSTWKGVTCDEFGQVTEIELRDLGLRGTISPSIGDLAHLSSLNLSESSLWGAIPSSLGRCQNLSVLDLSHNSLGGQVPAELFALPRLEILWLSDNSISGRLPEVVVANGCQSLTNLWIDITGISGALPSSLSKCQNLEMVSLSNNLLYGSIPAALGDLLQLQELWLDSNEFSGPIPSELGSLTKLQWLILEDNSLGGEIPPSLGALSDQLLVLNLKSNQLTGPIPPFLGNCTSLVNLMLGYNKLTGTIPKELGDLSNIEEFGFESNLQLTGPVPGFLSRCSKLRVLLLGACGFTSISPEIWSMKSLEHFIVFSNGLIGELPLEVGNCTSLTWLDLGWNNLLTGSIPPTLGLLTNLATLSLQGNAFTGAIPAELGNLKQLETLWLGRNYGLSGSISREVSSLTTLVDIDLGFCYLSGAIPEDLFTNNRNIKRLLLNNNQLSGTVPASIGNLTKLRTLVLASNALNGTIPEDLVGCESLTDLDLSSNYFTSGIPKFLGNFSSLVTLDLSHNALKDNAIALSSLDQCSKLEILLIGYNNIYGSLDVNFAWWPSLKYFSVTSNNLIGGIPLSFGSINSSLILADFSQNKFNGGFPVQVSGSHLSELRVLLFSHNEIQGPIPFWFGDLRSLQVLDLSFNQLIGSIPMNFGNLDGFKVPMIGYLSLPNVASTSIQRLTLVLKFFSMWLSELLMVAPFMDLSSNALQEDIPLGLANLVGVQSLNLSNNRFDGNLWASIENFWNLGTFDVSQNNLSGPLFSVLPPFLSTFNVFFNNFSGAIPIHGRDGPYYYDRSGRLTFGIEFDSSSYLPGNPGLCGKVIQRPCVGENVDPLKNVDFLDNQSRILDYISLPGFGIGATIGFCVVAMIALLWAPARAFVVLGRIRKKKAGGEVQSAYGLFRPKF